MNIYQQGENVLLPIDKLPEGEVTEVSSVIIGHSETGHHHILTSEKPIKVIEIDDRMYIETMFEALLTHKKEDQKHDDVKVDKGAYEVKHKTEYNPVSEVEENVTD